MMLLLHILIALTSIVVSGLAYAKPDKRRLTVSYGLVVATLTTGTYLVASAPAHLASACASGLIYLGIVGAPIAAAHAKLAHEQI
jgi:hypothetical protein